jgi:hypothetical protein
LERQRDEDSMEIEHCRLNLNYAGGIAGRLVEAFDLVAEAEDALKRSTNLRPCRPSLAQGRNTRAGHDRALEVEQSFRNFIEIALRIRAKSWELLGTLGLARLLRDTDRREEARAMLADIYKWFTESFDTADLRNAKALLNELS